MVTGGDIAGYAMGVISLLTLSRRGRGGIRLLAAALLCGLSTAALSDDDLLEVFAHLEQLQDANLNIARQMSLMERRAAEQLEAVLASGAVVDPVQSGILARLAANSITLATIVLAPLPAAESAAGDGFADLLHSNGTRLREAAAVTGADPDFRAALAAYSILQLQVEDMTVALQSGWHRYSELLGEAQQSGLIAPESFNATTKSWSLPDPLSDDVMSALRDSVVQPAAAGEPDPIAAVPPAATTPDPRLTGTPAEPAAAESSATAAEPTPATVEAPWLPAVPKGTEGWELGQDASGMPSARSTNLDAGSVAEIKSLTIECGDDGLVVFRIGASKRHDSFAVSFPGAVPEAVAATDNLVSGAEALRLSNALSMAYAAGDLHLILAPSNDAATGARFATDGFIEARATVVSSCAGELAASILGSGTPRAGAPKPDPAVSEPLAAPVPAPAPNRPAAPSPASPTSSPDSVPANPPAGAINLL